MCAKKYQTAFGKDQIDTWEDTEQCAKAFGEWFSVSSLPSHSWAGCAHEGWKHIGS